MAELDYGKPYDGQGTSLKVTKRIYYPQLADAINKVLPEDVNFVAEGDVEGDGEVTLHFSHDIDLDRVSKVVEDHEIDYNHGLTEDQVAINDLKARLGNGDLALKDLNKLLRLYFKVDLQEEL